MIVAVIAIRTVTQREIVTESIHTQNLYAQAQNNEESTLGGYADYIKEEKLNAQGVVELTFKVRTILADELIYSFTVYAPKGTTWGEWINTRPVISLSEDAPFETIYFEHTSQPAGEGLHYVGVVFSPKTSPMTGNFSYAVTSNNVRPKDNEIITSETYNVPYPWDDLDS